MEIKDTKTRYWTWKSFSAPRMESGEGSLIKLLKHVLVTGSPQVECSSFQYHSDNQTLSFQCDTSFGIGQVVKISGHPDSKLNTEFRVRGFEGTRTIVNCKTDLGSIQDGTANVQLASLGFTLAYDDIDTNGFAVFKAGDPDYPVHLRVKDKTPNNWGNDRPGRRALIDMGLTLGEEGGFKDGLAVPYRSDYPNPLFNQDTYKHSGHILAGPTSWVYRVNRSGQYLNSAGTGYIDPHNNWVIIGDDRGFYISCYSDGGTACKNLWYFGEVVDYRLDKNYAILASLYNWVVNVNNHISPDSHKRLTWNFSESYNMSYGQAGLLRHSDGTLARDLDCPIKLLDYRMFDNTSIRNSSMKPIATTGDVLMLPAYILTTSPARELAGHLRGIKRPIASGELAPLGELYKDHINLKDSSGGEVVEYFASLEDWY